MTLKHPVSLVVSASTLDITPGLSDGDTPLYVFTPDSGSTISGLVTTTVTLDSGSYGASLTVTGSGSILAASSDGVDGSTAGISLLNQGIIVGATANGQYDYYTRYYVYNGGAGVDFTAAGTVTNDGTITGGNSFSDSQNFGVYGGFGILLTGAGAVTNTGIVTGGNGSYGVIEGGTGGAGVRLEGDAMLSNMGTIQGGAGGFTTNGYAGGNGGLGVRCGLGGFVTTLMNAGTILGGIVGQATASNAYQFGGGGVAALNAYVLNTGTIQGGAGNATSAGGNGVELYGGTLVNAGTISAGSGVPGDRNGEAVRLYGEYKETLVVDPGAVFNGQVEVVYHFGHDAETLDLAGTTAATLTGIGTQFTGFTNIGFDTGAQWTLEGTTAALAGGQTIAGFTGGDTIVLDGFVETSETYVAGTGVVLSNGSTSLTLALTGANPADKFAVSTYGGNTSIGLLASAPAVSTISTAVATAVMLGSPAYTATLTVTGTGSITPAGAYGGAGVYGDVAGVFPAEQRRHHRRCRPGGQQWLWRHWR